jgi:hypothetical protein
MDAEATRRKIKRMNSKVNFVVSIGETFQSHRDGACAYPFSGLVSASDRRRCHDVRILTML